MATTVRTAHPPAATTAAAIPSLPSFRPDIQGLRAVAVLVVILDHLFGWPAGGFVGVDVFFVISGYLITSLLLREHAKTGRISWVDFYRRRVKRIMPASTLVLVVTVIAAFFIYRTTRFESTRTDALWGFLFASNWRFATIGTDYWQADGPVSPLRHFWSLAVEEQFYIVWPVLLIVVLGVVGRQLRIRGRSPQPLLVASMAAVAAASFLWALYETATDPTFAYFSTFSRAWELAVGALLAATASQCARIPVAVRPVVSYIGLAGIATSLFVIDSTSVFPAPWALLPVLSAAAVIGAGIGGTPRNLGVLTNRPMVFVGKISYSLYLWHFPVIILLGSLFEVGTAGFYGWATATMLALSIGSFYLVEDPVRRSHWLESRAQGRRGNRGSDKVGHGRRNLAVVTCVLAVGVAGVSLKVAQDRALTGAYTSSVGTVADAVTTPDEDLQAGVRNDLSGAITQALSATDWPALEPSIDEVVSDGRSQGCAAADVSVCEPNVAAPATAMIIGDSVAQRLVWTAREALHDSHNVQLVAQAACAVIDIDITFVDTATRDACMEYRSSVVAAIQEARPAVVFLTQNYAWSQFLTSKAVGTAAAAEWNAGLVTFLDRIKGSAGRVIVVAPGPDGKKLAECAATQSATPQACVTTLPAYWHEIAAAEADAVGRVGATFWDTASWYCDAENRCPAFVDQSVTRFDNVHMTTGYAHTLVPVFTESFGT